MICADRATLATAVDAIPARAVMPVAAALAVAAAPCETLAAMTDAVEATYEAAISSGATADNASRAAERAA